MIPAIRQHTGEDCSGMTHCFHGIVADPRPGRNVSEQQRDRRIAAETGTSTVHSTAATS
jgi:hypothetical protein